MRRIPGRRWRRLSADEHLRRGLGRQCRGQGEWEDWKQVSHADSWLPSSLAVVLSRRFLVLATGRIEQPRKVVFPNQTAGGPANRSAHRPTGGGGARITG